MSEKSVTYFLGHNNILESWTVSFTYKTLKYMFDSLHPLVHQQYIKKKKETGSHTKKQAKTGIEPTPHRNLVYI